MENSEKEESLGNARKKTGERPNLAFPQKEGGDEEKELFDDEETESS